ncbi:leucine-rich repeat domain-containing protein [Arcanobacterium phocae]|uniref:leucine-rich repeat domain-containing protein n=1 Tax=Arcanobacterium phocae TaxID=131112 RepID=UPI001C0EC877|nr:leucine-rich repeat domain-containing protein [Arcanobacterium phocae]
MSNHLRRRRVITLVSTLGVLSLGVAPAASAQITAEAQLASCVTAQAKEENVPEDSITRLSCRFTGGEFSDLSNLQQYSKLESVDLQRVKIQSLEGLEKLTSLTSLALYQADINDISRLENLTNLTSLSLNENKIEDVAPLAKLTKLQKLELRKNYLFDLSPLKDLTAQIDAKLQRPMLTRYVGDPIPAVKNKSGEVLRPSKETPKIVDNLNKEGTYKVQYRDGYNFIVNMTIKVLPANEKPADDDSMTPSPISSPPETEPDNSKSPVTDPMLRSCIRLVPEHRIGGHGEVMKEHVEQLTELRCVGRNISSLEGLQHAKNLRVLDLTQNHLSDLGPLNNLPKLEVLRLDQAEVKDLSALKELPNLKELYLYNNDLRSIDGLGNFPRLTHISLMKNKISTIDVLKKYPELTFVNVAQNQITSLKPVSQITKLEDLRAHHNNINDIAGLKNLNKLTNLELGANKIYSIEELRELTQLRTISVRENKITDISPLAHLAHPYRVDVSYNPIANASVLDSLKFDPKDPKVDPNEAHGLINIQNKPAPVPVPESPEGAVVQWYGAPGAATGSAIAQQSCDFTGDGKEDIVVGAWAHQEETTGMVGVAYVVPNGAKPGDLDDPATGAIKIYGPQVASLTGFNVSCVGDVNGDGKADIGVSSHKADRGYVVFGTDKIEPIHLNKLGDKGIEISSRTSKIGAGWIVTGAGDLNGDKLADIAVVSQAGGKDKRGEVTIIAGSATSSPITLQDSERILARIVGNTDMPVFNFTQAGDVDGDGVGDFLVGGYYAIAPQAQSPKTGMAWVISGKSRGTINVSEDLDGFAIQGPLRGGDRLGIAVAPLGDINNDGYADVMVGANPTKGNGSVAVVLGAAEHNMVTIDPEAQLPVTDKKGSRGWWIVDSRPAGYLGYGMSAVPARNGNTGTIILGSSQAARAVAFDTSVLTGIMDNSRAQPVLGGIVDIAKISPDSKVELQGNNDRLGRAIGVVKDFNEYSGALMVAGADRAGNPTGRGSIVLAMLPAVRSLGHVVPDKPDAPSKPDTDRPRTDNSVNNRKEQPKNDTQSEQTASTKPHVTTLDLAHTGVGIEQLGWAVGMLLVTGGGFVGYRKYYRKR